MVRERPRHDGGGPFRERSSFEPCIDPSAIGRWMQLDPQDVDDVHLFKSGEPKNSMMCRTACLPFASFCPVSG
jgi:hypothetical protein